MNYAVKNIYGRTNGKKIAVSVPGSKSITARALLTAAIAKGESVLYGASLSDDCQTFLNCLEKLGICARVNGTTVKITGCGGRLSCDNAEIDVGSAGTAARFLPAFLAFQTGRFTLRCSAQMQKRPVEPLLKSLESLGAKFTFSEKPYAYPFTIEGTASPRDEICVDIEKSSQYLSALLISAACLGKPFFINPTGEHGKSYVSMTLSVMRSFGANVSETDGGYAADGGYIARRYEIEPDVSAACYFYAMNKILGTDIAVSGLKDESVQGDIHFIKLLKGFDGGKADMSAFSDQALTLAAIAPYFSRPTQICGVGHIRGQECDRIKAVITNLSAMGVKCVEREDGVVIYPSKPRPATIKTFGDHRVAMSFALTGLRTDGIIIENAEVCSKTFRNFFEVLDGACAELTR